MIDVYEDEVFLCGIYTIKRKVMTSKILCDNHVKAYCHVITDLIHDM